MPYPIFPEKYREKSLLTAKDMLNYKKKLGLYPKIKPPIGVIFTFQPNLMHFIVKNYPVKKVRFLFGDFYILEDTDGKVGICGNFGIGAPIAASLLEELNAFGIKYFISVGIAGSLQKHLQLGSIIVCERAIRDEGTSYHYAQSEKYSFPSQFLTEKMIETIKKKDLNYSIGTTWTTDAPYRETIKEVKHYREEGVLTVEMEASAIFAVAKYLKSEAAALFTISDYLGDNEWNKHFHLAIKHLPNLFLIAKETLNSLFLIL
jgi:uridine phosphorylase